MDILAPDNQTHELTGLTLMSQRQRFGHIANDRGFVDKQR